LTAYSLRYDKRKIHQASGWLLECLSKSKNMKRENWYDSAVNLSVWPILIPIYMIIFRLVGLILSLLISIDLLLLIWIVNSIKKTKMLKLQD